MIQSIASDPLTLNESVFLAEQTILIDVIAHQTMPSIEAPLFVSVYVPVCPCTSEDAGLKNEP